MGKSDSFVFKEYLNVLNEYNNDSIKSVAFLGFPKENDFTLHVNGKIRHFYDLSLKNWDINSNWKLKQNYDLIVCTRCAYFSKNPQIIGLIFTSILFGLTHFSQGFIFILLATICGFFYGLIFIRTRYIEASILLHFLINLTHFIFFSYPSALEIS